MHRLSAARLTEGPQDSRTAARPFVPAAAGSHPDDRHRDERDSLRAVAELAVAVVAPAPLSWASRLSLQHFTAPVSVSAHVKRGRRRSLARRLRARGRDRRRARQVRAVAELAVGVVAPARHAAVAVSAQVALPGAPGARIATSASRSAAVQPTRHRQVAKIARTATARGLLLRAGHARWCGRARLRGPLGRLLRR